MTTQANLDWTATDKRAVDLIRVLAMDAVQKVGNGHPGTAMSLAPAAYLLFQRMMRHDPADPNWLGRDRFVLSCGHSSLTLYIQLYLSGYGLTLDDLKALRPWGIAAPRATRSTGTPPAWRPPPARSARASATPWAWRWPPAASAACSTRTPRRARQPVRPLRLRASSPTATSRRASATRLARSPPTSSWATSIVLYDDNQISIEDDTNIAKSEDVAARYEAYGWHVQRVDWIGTAGGYREDVGRPVRGDRGGQGARPSRPSFIALRTIIGWPAPNKQNTGKVHGSALGADEVAATKEILGFDPDETSPVDDEVLEHARQVAERGREAARGVGRRLRRLGRGQPGARALFDRIAAAALPDGWTEALPAFPADAKGMATRKASGEVLNALAPVLPELWGGSADLAESNNTTMEGEPSFIPADHQTKDCGPATRTAGPCTSASASTAWARSSTASRCTAGPGPTAARSCCSATTCARRSGWPR